MNRFAHPNIIFLDEDLQKSAEYCSNRFLDYNIKSCCQILMCSLYYMVGIRSRKFHQYYFSKERKTETINMYFDGYPYRAAPTFVKYTSPESKWCRMCKNHYDYICNYLQFLLDEFSIRFGKDHPLYDMLDFLKMAQYHISLKHGIKVVYLNLRKITLPWKSLPLKYREKDIINGYRRYYMSQVPDPFMEYSGTKRDIPEFFHLDEKYPDLS